MAFVVSYWRQPWSPLVYAVDSSLTGFGVVKSRWTVDDVRQVGRVGERSRYRLGPTAARPHALQLGGFVVGDDGRLIHTDDGFLRVPADMLDEIEGLKCERNADFAEVPSRLQKPDLW